MLVFVKKALDQKEQSQQLVALLDKRIAGFEEARDHKIVHMSNLSRSDGFCPREFALLDVLKKKPKGQYINTALRVAFDNGHALSDLCRNKWLIGDVVGSWRCQGCAKTVEFSKRPKNECPKCKADLWRYEEEKFTDPATGAEGSIDFFIDFGMGKHTPVEVKSISKDEFKELKAPEGEHRLRTMLYLTLISRSTRPCVKLIDTSFGIVLYISKGFGAKTTALNGKVIPFKEFRVERDDDYAAPYFKRAEELAAYRKGGAMPHGICPNGMVKRVASCSAAKECWSGNYPAGV